MIDNEDNSPVSGQKPEELVARREAGYVGYGSPPEARKWKKGQSGNPKGREKGSENFRTILLEETSARVTVRERGQRKRLSVLRATVRQLVLKAAAGDLKAATALLKEVKELLGVEPTPTNDVPPSEEDLELLRNRAKLLTLLDDLKQDNGPADAQTAGQTDVVHDVAHVVEEQGS